MEDKDILIRLQGMEEEEMIEELHESQIDDLKAEYHENIILLNNLLKEVSSQIEAKSPNLIKIKEMINTL